MIMASVALVISCMTTGLTAGEPSDPTLLRQQNQKQWVCGYTRNRNDVLLLRCDDLFGLLNDHILFEDGPQSKTTQFIPIWSRPASDEAAINLVRILLCDRTPDCSVEMSPAWASNI
jgi:hypothetical protein